MLYLFSLSVPLLSVFFVQYHFTAGFWRLLAICTPKHIGYMQVFSSLWRTERYSLTEQLGKNSYNVTITNRSSMLSEELNYWYSRWWECECLCNTANSLYSRNVMSISNLYHLASSSQRVVGEVWMGFTPPASKTHQIHRAQQTQDQLSALIYLFLSV